MPSELCNLGFFFSIVFRKLKKGKRTLTTTHICGIHIFKLRCLQLSIKCVQVISPTLICIQIDSNTADTNHKRTILTQICTEVAIILLKNKTKITAAYSCTTKHIETLYYKVDSNKLNPRFADTLSPRCLQGVHTHFESIKRSLQTRRLATIGNQ